MQADLEFFEKRMIDLEAKATEAYDEGDLIIGEYFMGKWQGYNACKARIESTIVAAREMGSQ